MNLKANFHTHSCFCDGSDTPEDIAAHAFASGFRQLGFSGHMDADIHMDFPAYLAEIRRLQALYAGRMEIFCGAELDCLYDPHAADGSDYLIGSTHFLDLPPLDGSFLSVDSSVDSMKTLAEHFFGGDYYRLSRAYYELEASVADRLQPSFLGHFDLVTRFNDLPKEQGGHFLDETDPRYLMPALEAMEYLVSRGLPFEINCGAVNRGRKKELYPCTALLRALREFGGEILISSDAHQSRLLDGGFSEAVRTAIACGFTHCNILTEKGSGAPAFGGSSGRKLYWKQLPLDSLL